MSWKHYGTMTRITAMCESCRWEDHRGRLGTTEAEDLADREMRALATQHTATTGHPVKYLTARVEIERYLP